jgi:hypothetical protein
MLDLQSVRDKKITLAELTANLTVNDLHRLTDEMVDTMLDLIAGATDADVVFIPIDPDADDPYAEETGEAALAWTLGHVIVHTTASAEEAAAQASELARGIVYTGRSRHEVPWQTITCMAQIHHRLEESRRMRHAYLNTWPDEPHLETTFTADYPGAKPRNAIQRFVAGLGHDDAHLSQIKEIMRQAQAARVQAQG